MPKKNVLESHYWTLISILSLVLVIIIIALAVILSPSEAPSETGNTSPERPQDIRVNKIPIDIELKPNTHIFYVMLKPENISLGFKIHAYLASEDSFDFYIFDKKEDISNSSARPLTRVLLMKNLDRTFDVEEGNVIVLVNSRGNSINVKGVVEYVEEQV